MPPATSTTDPFVLVMAKSPVPGRVKTRLCPPCTPRQAADLAAAAIADTVDAALASRAGEVVIALDGEPGPWLPAGVRVVPQVDGPFDRRLAAAWAGMRGPGIQIGMDTPQVDAAALDEALDRLAETHTDAVLGPAADGGWWLLGLPAPDDRVFRGVPMSTAETGRAQHQRLIELGYRVDLAPTVRDVDHFADALEVAGAAPDTRFARAVRSLAAVADR